LIASSGATHQRYLAARVLKKMLLESVITEPLHAIGKNHHARIADSNHSRYASHGLEGSCFKATCQS
ncbi:MAG: hypothetical protein WCK00_15785, partial [Deltaproteobacteria bacterium]